MAIDTSCTGASFGYPSFDPIINVPGSTRTISGKMGEMGSGVAEGTAVGGSGVGGGMVEVGGLVVGFSGVLSAAQLPSAAAAKVTPVRPRNSLRVRKGFFGSIIHHYESTNYLLSKFRFNGWKLGFVTYVLSPDQRMPNNDITLSIGPPNAPLEGGLVGAEARPHSPRQSPKVLHPKSYRPSVASWPTGQRSQLPSMKSIAFARVSTHLCASKAREARSLTLCIPSIVPLRLDSLIVPQ